MIKLESLIDVNRLGDLLLTDVSPDREYVDGKPTDTIKGYRYVCVALGLSYEKVAIKISGGQQMTKPNTPVPVVIEGLRAIPYIRDNRIQIVFKGEIIRADKR